MSSITPNPVSKDWPIGGQKTLSIRCFITREYFICNVVGLYVRDLYGQILHHSHSHLHFGVSWILMKYTKLLEFFSWGL